MMPYLIDFGFIKIPTYGFMIAIAYFLSYYYLSRRAAEFNFNKSEFSDLIFYTVIYGFIGAKILYIITFFKGFGDGFYERIINIFSIENIRSGFVFWGGAIGGGLYLYIYSRRKKISFLRLADFFSLAIPLAHGIGRIGCFSAGCCYGKPTDSIFGVRFTKPYCEVDPSLLGIKIHPTQLYESFGNFLIFLFLNKVSKKYKMKEGNLFFLYILSYSILRFIVEFFRGDERGSYILGFSQAQFISIIAIVSVLLTLWLRRK